MICKVDGCERRAKAIGLCGNHYALNRRNGKPERIAEKVYYDTICSVSDCNSPHSAKGYCSLHYARFSKYGLTDLPKKQSWSCLVDGCTSKKHKAKGFCGFHYERHINDTRIDIPKRCKNSGKTCSVESCESLAATKGLCVKHYQRWRAHGDPNHLSKNRRPRGGGKEWHINLDGYIVRYEPSNQNSGSNGQVYQHRHVMSEMIGRPLRAGENVHHVNGNRSDNRPENLELWKSNQPSGQRVQDLVRYAISIIENEAGAAIALDPALRGELQALALNLKML